MIVIVMGIVGSGKTTVGSRLAQQQGWRFADADDFHSAENKDKMHRGIGLTDADRVPWLQAMHDAIVGWIAAKDNVVLACSALKDSYRRQLCVGPEVRLVYLKGSRELIKERLSQRKGHYATESILDSQMETLEEPKDAIVIDVSGTPDAIVKEIEQRLPVN